MLMAATVVPAFAQQSAPATQILEKMVAPAQTPAATPEQRAAVFSSMAVLPADLQDFFTFTDIAGNMTRLAGSGAFPDLEVDDLPSEMLALDGATFASHSGNAASYKALARVIAAYCTAGQTEALAGSWARQAAEAAAVTIRDTVVQYNKAQVDKAIAAMSEVKIHPIYGVLTCKPGNEGMLQEWCAAAVGNVQSDLEEGDGFEPVDDLNGFSGVKVDLSKAIDTDEDLPAEYLERVKDNPEYILGNAAEKEVAKRTIYVLFKQQGNALIAVICEDPSEIKLAANPAESVLATDIVAEADANLGKGMIALGHFSPTLLATSGTFSPANVEGLGDAMSGIFTALGSKDAANKAAYDKAAAGVKTAVAQLSPILAQATRPVTMQAWCDSDLHFQFSGDAQGVTYTPSPLRNIEKMAAPNTALYCAITPCTGGPALPSLPKLMDAALDISRGVNLTHANQQTSANATLDQIEAVMPEAKEAIASIGTIIDGLDGNIAFVCDSAVAPVPVLFGSAPGKTASVPRLAWSFGVSDRSKLSQGWDNLVAASGKLIGKLGGNPDSVGMLPIAPSTEGDVTHYSVIMPFFNKDTFVPTLAVSDSGLVAGTSTTLNTELIQPATTSANFAGGVFMLRFEPLAAMLDSLGDALAEETPAKGASGARRAQAQVVTAEGEQVVVEIDEDDDEVEVEYEDDYDEDADYDEDYDYEDVAPKSPQQRRSENLKEAAEFFRDCNRVVEGIYATSTTENGHSVLRVDVKLR